MGTERQKWTGGMRPSVYRKHSLTLLGRAMGGTVVPYEGVCFNEESSDEACTVVRHFAEAVCPLDGHSIAKGGGPVNFSYRILR